MHAHDEPRHRGRHAQLARALTAFAILSVIAAPQVVHAQPAGGACRHDYWAAPWGNDANAGNALAPFKTLDRARDAVRADPMRTQCEIVVNLRGEHRLDHSLMLDARDSGGPSHDVVWRSALFDNAVVSGAIKVGNWALHDSAKNIWRAYTGPRASRQLYVNGQRAIRAQTAPYPAEYARTASGYKYIGPAGQQPVWSNISAIEAVTVTQWKMMRCPVASITGPDIAMQLPCWSNANAFGAAAGQPILWSFTLLTRFENAYEFLHEPGQWYLDGNAGWLYYIPRAGESMATADVELPIVEALVDATGASPISHVRFENLTFAYATWLTPSGPEGYAADQSGFTLTGGPHAVNIIGHDPEVTRTPGNVRLRFATNVQFTGNTFIHLGGVGLDFQRGSQDNAIVDNVFEDISSAAIQLGGVDADDARPPLPAMLTRDNRIANNLVHAAGREYFDAAGIYVGFTTRSIVEHNDISDVPWTGIAIGWGWGLRDPGTKEEPLSFPGLPQAYNGEWGTYATPSASRGNRILHNRIRRYLMELWDGGAIYTLGQQGRSLDDGEVIAWNVASDKRPASGSNTFYTDGGSRFVTLYQNVSFNNPVGLVDFGPCGLPTSLPYCVLNFVPYGSDMGGCVPHGDLEYIENYFSSLVFYDPCPYKDYPRRVHFAGNHKISSPLDVPRWILQSAGRQ